MQDFKKLVVWQKAHMLAIGAYKATAGFPHDELYGLTAQLRRACVSIPANIAEGCGRDGEAEFGRFLQILGSGVKFLKSPTIRTSRQSGQRGKAYAYRSG